MREETPSIVPFVKEQFPAFYHEDGPAFVAFVEAYYEWLAEENNVGDLARNIYNLRDIDRTIDDFVLYFRTKYLADFGYLASVDTRKLIKHSHELFGTKGTEQGFKLLFQLLFNQEINVYYPGNDVLRASDGKWFQPRYLEVSPSSKNASFLYQEITGTTSGAKAFVEGVVRRTIGARIFDVFYLSNIRGQFQASERITSDGVVDGSPLVLGSLVEIDITNGGANFAIGDVLEVSEGSGVGGQARVTAVENATGKVNFTLNDGGSGYRLTASVKISDAVMRVANTSNTDFEQFEDVLMDIQTIGYASGSGDIDDLAVIEGRESVGNTVVANGIVLASNATHIIVNLHDGDFLAADDLYSNAHSSLVANVANTDATGTFLGYTASNQNIGIDEVNGTFYVGGTLQFLNSNNTAVVQQIYTGANAGFAIGSLTNEEPIFLWTDFLEDENEEGVPFLEIVLNGSNANTGANTYGFPKPITGYSTNLDSLIADALSSDTFDVGEIASIAQVRPGSAYNADPFIVVHDELTAGFDRRNLILNITNANGVLLTGERVRQDIQVPGYDLTITYTNAETFEPNEGVVQENTGAEGQVVSGNSTHLVISSYNAIPFGVGNTIVGMTSNAHANVSANVYLASEVNATGEVVSANTLVVHIRPTSLSTLFDTSYAIVGLTSNATANIVTIDFDNNSAPMGLNANVSGRVVTANGVVSTVAVKASGFGYIDGEEVELSDANNVTVATGTVNLDNYGTGRGYWKNTDSFLSADKYLHDNNYYQAYAYEIQTGISLSRYADVLKKSFHIAGMRLFGKVVRVEKIRESTIDVTATVTV